MKLINLKLKNLFSFDSLEFNMDKRGVLLITGWDQDNNTANGSGKSSLTSKAISWILYGKTINGLKGDEVKRIGSEGESWGQIEFDSCNGMKYRITRYRNPSKTVLEHFNVDEWQDISNKIQTETQETINKLLKKDFRVFSNTDFFGQGQSNTFLTMNSLQQNSLFEFVISLDQITKLVTRTKARKVDVLDRSTVNDKKIAKTIGALNEVELQIANLNNQKRVIDNAKNELIDDLQDISLDELVIKLENELANHKFVSQNNVNLYQSLLQKSKELSYKQNNLRSQKRKIKKNTCPTCDQVIDESLYNKLVESQKNIFKDIELISSQLNDINKDMPLYESLKNEANSKLKIIENKLQKISILKGQVETIYITNSLNRKEEYEKELLRYNAIGASLKDELMNVAFWERAFNLDFRNFLIEKSCPFLEERASKHIREMGQPHLQINFSTDKELKSGDHKVSFNATVKNLNGGASGYDSLSGGEQQFVSFATWLAFSDLVSHVNGFDSNVMILDEPFMFLDSANAEKLVSYINNYLVKIKDTVLLVSNESSIKDLFPQKITVIKEKGISRLN